MIGRTVATVTLTQPPVWEEVLPVWHVTAHCAPGAGGWIAQWLCHINVLFFRWENRQINYLDINLIANKSRRQPAYLLYEEQRESRAIHVAQNGCTRRVPVRAGKQREVTLELNAGLLRYFNDIILWHIWHTLYSITTQTACLGRAGGLIDVPSEILKFLNSFKSHHLKTKKTGLSFWQMALSSSLHRHDNHQASYLFIFL